MKKQKAYETIKELVDHKGNKNRAAKVLGCSKRTIDRYIAGYRKEGKAYFVHGNTGRRPVTALDEKTKEDILELYQNTYYSANFSHYTELLQKQEQDPIIVSESTVRNILGAADILSPKATRKTRRKVKARLAAKLKETGSKNEAKKIEAQIIEVENAHPRRPRCSSFGEMIQMDATLHLWSEIANGHST